MNLKELVKWIAWLRMEEGVFGQVSTVASATEAAGGRFWLDQEAVDGLVLNFSRLADALEELIPEDVEVELNECR